MKKWTVEMSILVSASIDLVAETREEAIKDAKIMLQENPRDFICVDEYEIEQVNYAG